MQARAVLLHEDRRHNVLERLVEFLELLVTALDALQAGGEHGLSTASRWAAAGGSDGASAAPLMSTAWFCFVNTSHSSARRPQTAAHARRHLIPRFRQPGRKKGEQGWGVSARCGRASLMMAITSSCTKADSSELWRSSMGVYVAPAPSLATRGFRSQE